MANLLAKIGMTMPEFVLGIILLVFAVVVVVLVLMQSGKDSQLSGTIAGGAETFFGKSKAASGEKKMTIATAILSVVFAVVVLVMYFYVATH